MKSVLKSINTNLQGHCTGTKTLPLDAKFNYLSKYMSCIEGSDYCHWKKRKTTPMRTHYNNEGNIKVIKEDFTKPLQRDKNITSRVRI